MICLDNSPESVCVFESPRLSEPTHTHTDYILYTPLTSSSVFVSQCSFVIKEQGNKVTGQSLIIAIIFLFSVFSLFSLILHLSPSIHSPSNPSLTMPLHSYFSSFALSFTPTLLSSAFFCTAANNIP